MWRRFLEQEPLGRCRAQRGGELVVAAQACLAGELAAGAQVRGVRIQSIHHWGRPFAAGGHRAQQRRLPALGVGRL
jgi:hypothetical protein